MRGSCGCLFFESDMAVKEILTIASGQHSNVVCKNAIAKF
jgi:hypothetical protein